MILVTNQIPSKAKLKGTPRIVIDTANSKGLYTPKIENHTTCLKTLISNVPNDNTKNIVISSTGNP